MAEQRDLVQTEIMLDNLIKHLNEYKEMWYPPSVVTKGMYKDGAIGKKQFNDIIIKAKTLKAKVKKTFDSINKKEKLLAYYIKPELRDFIKSDEITSDKYIVAFMHNYFILNCLYHPKDAHFIVPNEILKTLFKQQLIENKVMNEDGELLDRECTDSERGPVKGFLHSELLVILLSMYVKTKKDNKRKQPSVITEEIKQRLTHEREVQDNIHLYRSKVQKLNKSIEKLKESIPMSKKYGDVKEMKEKIDTEEKKLGKLKKEFREYCDNVSFPYDKKYFF